MELKGRLKLIQNKIPICNTMCDIGTDHAYLPIALIDKNICNKAIAADIKKGPTLAAIRNIKQFGMEHRIEARMGDGLDPIHENEAEVIVIAGMGGILIKDILEKGISKAKTAKSLILQPMNAIEVLREWLNKNGFDIFDEELISEGEKIYHVISVTWTQTPQKIDNFYYYIGLKLIERNDPLLKKYILRQMKLLRKAIQEMEASDDKVEQIRVRYTWLLVKMQEVLAQLG